MVLHRHVYIVFLSNPPLAILELPNSQMAKLPKNFIGIELTVLPFCCDQWDAGLGQLHLPTLKEILLQNASLQFTFANEGFTCQIYFNDYNLLRVELCCKLQ